MTQLSDVMTVGTPAQKLEALLTALEARSLNARGWQPYRVHRALVEIQADTSSTTEQIIYDIASGGFPDSATGAWLDLIAWGWFRELRGAARTAIVRLRLSDIAGQGPYTLGTPIAVAYPQSSSPLYYRSQAGSVTVPRNGYVDAAFVAETTGAVYNVTPGQITTLATPIPGVAVTSPAIFGQGTIILQEGADPEADSLLAQRCADKWGLLAQGYTVAKIRALARQCDSTLERFAVLDPGGLAGVADMYMATGTLPATPAQVAAVYDYLRDPSRRPVGSLPVRCYPAGMRLQRLMWNVYLDGTNGAAVTDATSRLVAYQSTLDLGAEIHISRLVDVVIDGGDKGIIGAVPTNLTGVEIIDSPRTDVVVFNNIWNTIAA